MYAGKDQNSHLFRYAVVNEHGNVSYDDFQIIGKGFRNNTFNQGITTNFERSGEVD